MSMRLSGSCLRAGAIRVCLALMLGLLLVSGYIVAPILFAQAGSNAEAGRLAGHIFHTANLGILILAAAVAMFWLRLGGQGRLRWLLLLLLAGVVAVNAFGLAPVMAQIKAQMGPIDLLARDDPQRVTFGMWHGISELLHLLASVCGVLLVAIGMRTQGDACSPS